jgi:hypothetical protein
VQIAGLTYFDLDNPEKAKEIPTQAGCMHKADTSDDADQRVDSSDRQTITERQEKTLHFFDTGR